LWEREGVRRNILHPPPPQSSPIEGEDITWWFSSHEGEVAVMIDRSENSPEIFSVQCLNCRFPMFSLVLYGPRREKGKGYKKGYKKIDIVFVE